MQLGSIERTSPGNAGVGRSQPPWLETKQWVNNQTLLHIRKAVWYKIVNALTISFPGPSARASVNVNMVGGH